MSQYAQRHQDGTLYSKLYMQLAPLFVSKDTTKLGLMLQATFFTSSIMRIYKWYVEFISPALTNQVSAFGATMI